MKTYVINLETSIERKEYILGLLNEYPFIDCNVIKGVDARKIEDDDMHEYFDLSKSYKSYGRHLKKGEIGCTLSHRRCAQYIIDNNDEYALILEDDVMFHECNLENILLKISQNINMEQPQIILLSGLFWFLNAKPLCDYHSLAKVYDAVGSFAYIMNRAAAKKILELPPAYLADDWFFLKRNGIKIDAILPRVAETNENDFPTTISPEYCGHNIMKMSLTNIIISYKRAVVKRVLRLLNKFETKNFK